MMQEAGVRVLSGALQHWTRLVLLTGGNLPTPLLAQQPAADLEIALGMGLPSISGGSFEGQFRYSLPEGADVIVEVGLGARQGIVQVAGNEILQISALFPGGSIFPSDDLFRLFECQTLDPGNTGPLCSDRSVKGESNNSGRWEADDLFRIFGALTMTTFEGFELTYEVRPEEADPTP